MSQCMSHFRQPSLFESLVVAENADVALNPELRLAMPYWNRYSRDCLVSSAFIDLSILLEVDEEWTEEMRVLVQIALVLLR